MSTTLTKICNDRMKLEVTLQERAEVLDDVRRWSCTYSSEVLAGIVRRWSCPSSSGELVDIVRRKGEGANPSSSEEHSDIADVVAEDVKKRAGRAVPLPPKKPRLTQK